MGRLRGITTCSLLGLAAFAVPPLALAQSTPADRDLQRDLLRELVEIRTVHPDGDNTAAARAMARRLLDAGFDSADVRVIEPAPLKGNLVARLRGSGELRPMLLLAHIDVVDARRDEWSDGLDPFRLTERDGYFYGRGTLDDKGMAAMLVLSLIRFKREGFRPKRDLIVALTADEEGGTHNGVGLLLKEHRALIDAEFALNEGAVAESRGGRPELLAVQVSEKMYLSFEIEATSRGGHSSLPERDNAIYDLAAALDRISRLELPARPNYVARRLAASMVQIESGELSRALAALAAGDATEADLRVVSAVPRYNAQLRTTCVATRIEGGHADNALPTRARATVNCRLLPGEKGELVQAELQKATGERLTVKPKNSLFVSEATDAQSPVMKTIEREAAASWPGVGTIPVMSAGATDGSRLRNAEIPVYGVVPIFTERGENRMHGRDERIGVRAFHDGAEFLHRLVRVLANGG